MNSLQRDGSQTATSPKTRSAGDHGQFLFRGAAADLVHLEERPGGVWALIELADGSRHLVALAELEANPSEQRLH